MGAGGLGEKHKGIKQKQKTLIDSDNSKGITTEKRRWGEVEEDKGVINGEGKRLDFER